MIKLFPVLVLMISSLKTQIKVLKNQLMVLCQLTLNYKIKRRFSSMKGHAHQNKIKYLSIMNDRIEVLFFFFANGSWCFGELFGFVAMIML